MVIQSHWKQYQLNFPHPRHPIYAGWTSFPKKLYGEGGLYPFNEVGTDLLSQFTMAPKYGLWLRHPQADPHCRPQRREERWRTLTVAGCGDLAVSTGARGCGIHTVRHAWAVETILCRDLGHGFRLSSFQTSAFPRDSLPNPFLFTYPGQSQLLFLAIKGNFMHLENTTSCPVYWECPLLPVYSHHP